MGRGGTSSVILSRFQALIRPTDSKNPPESRHAPIQVPVSSTNCDFMHNFAPEIYHITGHNKKTRSVMIIEDMLEYNRHFVNNKGYESHITDKYPDKKLAILTCIDTRLTTLLPAALGLRNGDVKLIKNAGAVLDGPNGSVIRSLMVAIYELGANEVMVVAHTDCGACHMSAAKMIAKMKERGIQQRTIDLMRYCGVNFEQWLGGFEDTERSVRQTVRTLREHPLLPKDIEISGYIIDSVTGQLTAVDVK